MPSENDTGARRRLSILSHWRALLAVLGTLALIEVVASFWPNASTAHTGATAQLPLQPETPPAEPPPGDPVAVPAPPAPEPTVGSPSSPAPPAITSNPFAPLPVPQATLTIPPPPEPVDSSVLPIYDPTAILDTKAATHMRNGNAHRDNGDHDRALAEYQLGLDLLPGHPRFLYEVAFTHEDAGHPDRAITAWSQIYRLGSSAGELFFIADSKLRDADGNALLSPDRPLAIAGVETSPEAASSGQHVVLNVTVQSHPGTRVDPLLLEAHVHFYDLVDGTHVAQTTADPPSSRWVSGPAIDWADGGQEILEVTYFHPQMTPAERARFGTRRYHGAIIKLYYDNQLVDQTAEPRTLLEFLFENEPAPPEIDPTLFGGFGNP